jgi:cation transport protein ChaC
MDASGMWVFGYGSLVWNPEFTVAEQVIARLSGYRRSFCMRSIHHRGSEDIPGLVLALDEQPGATAIGLALRVADGMEAATLIALRERELISSAYLERIVTLDLQDGRTVQAVAYVIDPDHDQYCHLDLEEQARVIAHAVGGRGPNHEYLSRTAQHLNDLGIGDTDLDWLCRRVTQLR